MSRISDIGRAENQSISPEVLGGTVEELRRDVQRLQTWYLNQRAMIADKDETIQEQSSRIQTQEERIADLVAQVWTLENKNVQLSKYNSEKDERVRELVKCDWDAQSQIDTLEHRLSNQARTIRVQAETIRRLEEQAESVSDTAWTMATRFHLDWAEKTVHLIAARCGAPTSCADAVLLVLETVSDAHIEIAKRRGALPTKDSTSPNEPPLPPEAANVPGEAVGVHPAPNVTRAGGE